MAENRIIYDGGRGVIGGERVEFIESHVFQPEYGWARKPDEADWHSVRYFAGERAYKPKCGAPLWVHSKGDGLLPIVPSQPFGPVCKACQSLEQLDCQTEAD